MTTGKRGCLRIRLHLRSPFQPAHLLVWRWQSLTQWAEETAAAPPTMQCVACAVSETPWMDFRSLFPAGSWQSETSWETPYHLSCDAFSIWLPEAPLPLWQLCKALRRSDELCEHTSTLTECPAVELLKTNCFKGLPFICLTGTCLGEGRLLSLGDFLQPTLGSWY